MPQNIGYLTADKTTAGDERFTPYYAVEPLLEFLPPADTGITIWCPFDESWSAYVQPSGQTVTTWCTVLWLPARTSSPASPLTGTL